MFQEVIRPFSAHVAAITADASRAPVPKCHPLAASAQAQAAQPGPSHLAEVASYAVSTGMQPPVQAWQQEADEEQGIASNAAGAPAQEGMTELGTVSLEVLERSLIQAGSPVVRPAVSPRLDQLQKEQEGSESTEDLYTHVYMGRPHRAHAGMLEEPVDDGKDSQLLLPPHRPFLPQAIGRTLRAGGAFAHSEADVRHFDLCPDQPAALLSRPRPFP